MKKLFYRERPLDLHNVSHSQVSRLVEDYVLGLQDSLPLKIITGNSDQMKSLVIECLKAHKFKYQIGDQVNKGYIAVVG